ncbi:alginate export family protein [Sphingomonas hengshuiensis]|uniref:alginate export family protein n=1 Tax=Sphingomonas hengshuiensis TaxID=1609977 RepID=UPI000B1273F0|nr:alginate export family protein [Sphingomonas hengshuiensis]
MRREMLGLVALVMPVGAAAQSGPAAPARAAEDGLDLSATVRLRYEAIDASPVAGSDSSGALFNVRSTLLARYQSGPVALVGELWDSRAYGDAGRPITTGEVNAAELVQAYAAVALPLAPGVKAVVRGGRFMLNIGSRRLVAADDYRNTTNGYTGVEAELTGKAGLHANLLYVLPQQRRPDDAATLDRNGVAPDREGFDLVLWGGTVAQAHAIGPVMVEASFYHLGERDMPGRPTRNRSLNTYGGRLLRDPAKGRVDAEVEGFYQSGRVRASTAPAAAVLPVSAWFVHGDVGYTLAGAWKPRLSVEVDRASGDRPGGSYGRFDTLFGMRRADLAPSGIYNAVGRANIAAAGARAEVTPSARVDAFASYHALWLAERRDAFSTTGVRDASGQAGAFAGHQLDARLRWWVRPGRLRFEADGVVLAKGSFLEAAPNAPGGGTTLYGSLNLMASF